MKAIAKRVEVLEAGRKDDVSLALKEWLGMPLTAAEQGLFKTGRARYLHQIAPEEMSDGLRVWLTRQQSSASQEG